MNSNTSDIIEYIIALINEFANAFGLSEHQAYLYLKNYNAIQFVENHYNVMHTLDFRDSVDGVANFCKRNGGKL